MRKANLNIWLLVCMLMMTLAVAVPAGAVTRYVPSPYPTIQEAIDASAVTGDDIEVAPGLYFEVINFSGKAIRLYSSDGPEVTTIAEVLGQSSVVTCNSGEGPGTILKGFTISGGHSDKGGGMYNDGSSPTVTNCIFSGNGATEFGGGIYNGNNSNPTVSDCNFIGNSAKEGGGMHNGASSSPTVSGCSFSHNTADWGGGMYNHNSSPTVVNCTFNGNNAVNATVDGRGGGMFNNWYSSPLVTDCIFISNSSDYYAGGMLNYDYSSPTVTDCTFTGNSAPRGGGMYNLGYSSPTLTNCTFSDNPAEIGGGGIYNNDYSSPTVINCTFTRNSTAYGGGMFNIGNSNPTVTNCTFSNNTAYTWGGGMYSNGTSPTLTNCTFIKNNADNGGGMLNNGSYPLVTNCIVWDNTGGQIIYRNTSSPIPMVTYSDVQDANVESWFGDGCIDADPCFVDANNPDPNASNYRLNPDSPCIDAGDNNSLPADMADLDGDGNTVEPIPFDLDGNPRVYDGDMSGSSIVDMGAYEFYDPLLAHWKLDETDGDTAWDSSGNGNHGTLYDDPNWQPSGGRIGGALEFDGDGDAVSIPKIDERVEFTYAMWVNQNVIGSSYIALIDHNDWITGSVHFELYNGRPKVGILDSIYPFMNLIADDTLAEGVWNHLVLTKSSRYLRLYVDAEPAAQEELTKSDPVILGDGYIGALLHPQYGDRCFNGLIDDVRIYNYALNAEQILHILCPEPIKGDLDRNCSVDFFDFSILARAWETKEGDPDWDLACDISDPPDNYINWRDATVLCENWLANP